MSPTPELLINTMATAIYLGTMCRSLWLTRANIDPALPRFNRAARLPTWAAAACVALLVYSVITAQRVSDWITAGIWVINLAVAAGFIRFMRSARDQQARRLAVQHTTAQTILLIEKRHAARRTAEGRP